MCESEKITIYNSITLSISHMGAILGEAQLRKKGQITIPEEVRKYLKLKIGDKISLEWENGKVIVRKVKTVYEDFSPDKQ